MLNNLPQMAFDCGAGERYLLLEVVWHCYDHRSSSARMKVDVAVSYVRSAIAAGVTAWPGNQGGAQ
jgi:hypothetical protein